MKKSVKLVMTTKSGSTIEEHHTNREAAEIALFTHFKSGVEIVKYDIGDEVSYGKPDKAVNGPSKAYSDIP